MRYVLATVLGLSLASCGQEIPYEPEAQAELSAVQAEDQLQAAPRYCEPNKICRGTDKREVLRILGTPSSVVVQQDGAEFWEWVELDVENQRVCNNELTADCAITFVRGRVYDQLWIDPVWLDLMNF